MASNAFPAQHAGTIRYRVPDFFRSEKDVGKNYRESPKTLDIYDGRSALDIFTDWILGRPSPVQRKLMYEGADAGVLVGVDRVERELLKVRLLYRA